MGIMISVVVCIGVANALGSFLFLKDTIPKDDSYINCCMSTRICQRLAYEQERIIDCHRSS